MALSRDIKIGGVLLLLFALLVAFFYYFFNDSSKYNWQENYNYESDQPYGVDILYNLLKEYNGKDKLELIDKQTVTQFFNEKGLLNAAQTNKEKATYVLLSEYTNYAARDYESLLAFLQKGNTVFIISSSYDVELMQAIDASCLKSNSYKSYLNHLNLFSVQANFENDVLHTKKGYRFFYEYKSKRNDHWYTYFGSSFCRSVDYEPLGYIRPNKTNFIKINVGEGQLLLHANPLFFSNRHMIRKQGKEYASKAFSYISNGEIYWDNHNKPVRIKKPSMQGNEDDTPFTYILKQRSFKWALYLIYFGVILFLVFNLFRKQKEIPVLFQNKNTSLEFIKNVGTLYYENKDNRKLAEKMMKHFMNEVRLKYFIKEKQTEQIVEKLASKTKVNAKQIESIFNSYAFIERQVELSDEALIKFYLKIENFHKSIKK